MIEALLFLLLLSQLAIFSELRGIRRRLPALFLLIFAEPVSAQPKKSYTPKLPAIDLTADWSGDVAACVADARRLSPHEASKTRYFTAKGTVCKTAEDVQEAAKMSVFHLWSISHEPEPPPLRWVTPTIWAANLEYCGISPFTYGNLSYRDPYHHVHLTEDGKKKIDVAAAPQLGKFALFWGIAVHNQAPIAELIKMTESQTPLLRWDWFWIETSIQEGRTASQTGYYDFLGIKNRDDFQKAVGFDPKLADKTYKRWRAIVKESGVSHFPRQIERDGSLDGGYWFTLDVLDQPTGPRNALRQLDKDFHHQAEEHYAIGPAGMPWLLACSNDGVLQNSAPDRVGPDKTRGGNRTTIDVGAGCIRCHQEILRPIANWAETSFKLPTTAELPIEKALAAQRLYFRPLKQKLDADRQAFADRILQCNGLDPKKNAEIYATWQDRYNEDRLGIDDLARELGTTPKRLGDVLLAVQTQKKLDPVLADLVASPTGKIRRESVEELFPVLIIYLGANP